MVRRPTLVAVTCGLAISTLTGCAGESGPAGKTTGTSAATNSPAVDQPQTSRIRAYQSLDEVASYSTDLVIGTVIGTPTVVPAAQNPTDDRLQSTIVRLRVDQDLGGPNAKPGQVLEIRQSGTREQPLLEQGSDTFLKPGSAYAVYLEPFSFEPGKSTGQYVIVGDKSFNYSTQSEQGTALNKNDPDTAQGFPLTLTATDLKNSLGTLGSKANHSSTETSRS